MKKLYMSLGLSVLMISIMTAALLQFVSVNSQIADALHEPKGQGYFFYFNLSPFLLLCLFLLVLSGIYFFLRRRTTVDWTFPLLFPDADERERQLVREACQRSYRVLWALYPIGALLLVFYPLLLKVLPGFPVLLFMAFPLLQVVIFFFFARKIYR